MNPFCPSSVYGGFISPAVCTSSERIRAAGHFKMATFLVTLGLSSPADRD